ncbi:ImmA/IrrE family metallo-endopeptidase [Methanococcus maripaludis]|uniref:Zn-dependent peptidase ImmA (M78 family) n=1 Tax=Methanococcus maripaludis TaxID=39152 RepID=A0A7J9SDF9_METMI|nr:ImmA/IrrE family metallo-endopeptidase [Methanococcus maripaludis]MBB6497302.1 Zn-dependent peptidase ImmA (M78 family) [Methanococcus maripaludis]
MLSRFEIKRRVDELLENNNIEKTIPMNITNLLTALGIGYHEINFREEDMDISGCICLRNNKLVILINQPEPEPRKRFTTAHEIGHLILHRNEAQSNFFEIRGGPYNGREQEADTFAAELLMPEELVRERYFRLKNPSADDLANIFNVSRPAMELRLIELSLKYE